MKKVSVFLCILILLLCFNSCSNTKYSGVRQTSTNFISYYNTHFNAQNKYKVGTRKGKKSMDETTNGIFPIFEYENTPEAFASVTEFEGIEEKVGKNFSKRPKSQWVDDGFLLNGKLYYMKGNYELALKNLQFVTSYYKKGYRAEDLKNGKLKWLDEKVKQAEKTKTPIKEGFLRHKLAKNEATIWIAKTLIKQKKYFDAQSVISFAESDMSFPIDYHYDLSRVQIMLYIENNEYQKAIELLDSTIHISKSKKDKGRMNFIMGQLYEKENNKIQALNRYEESQKYPLNNTLEFEAKMKVSELGASNNLDQSIKFLNGLANVGRYAPKLGRIYYAMGCAYLQNKQDQNAIVAFKKSIANSEKDPNQKFYSFLKLAEYYYDNEQFISSSEYYDSAKTVLPATFTLEYSFAKRQSSLSLLTKQYRIVKLNDSFLELANMGRDKAFGKIRRQFAKEKEKHEIEQLQSETVLASNNNAPVSTFYFYNEEAMKNGRLAFKKQWGDIKLTDNWRKKTSTDILSKNNDPSKDGTIDPKDPSMSSEMMAEIELKKIPFEESKKKDLNLETEKALFNMANLYNYDLENIKKAIETNEELLRRYPNQKYTAEVLYSLFVLYRDQQEYGKAEEVKKQLIARFPDSKYTEYAKNPDQKSQEQKKLAGLERDYKALYLEYDQRNFQFVSDKCDIYIAENPQSPMVSKFKFLKSQSVAKLRRNEEYIALLKDISTNYPTTTEGKAAKEILEWTKESDGTQKTLQSILNTSEEKKENPPQNEQNQQLLRSLKEKETVQQLGRQSISMRSETIPIETAPVDAPKPMTNDIKVNTPPTTASSTSTPGSNNTTATPSNSPTATTGSLSNPTPTSNSNISEYAVYDQAIHYALIDIKNPNEIESIIKTLNKYHVDNIAILKLQIDQNLINYHNVLVIKKFDHAGKCAAYIDMMKNETALNSIFQNNIIYPISLPNFNFLIISKNWDGYVVFANEHY